MKSRLKSLLGQDLISALRLRWSILCAQRSARVVHQLPPSGAYVQVGGGGRILDGFANVDLIARPGVLQADISHRLPFANASVDGLFAEHVVEHLEAPVQLQAFLKECRRVLKPGGRVRFVVPDAGRYLQAYVNGDWDVLAQMRPLVTGSRDYWFDVHYRTKMELINMVFRQFGEHRFAYDAETILLYMQDGGFVSCEQKAFGQGNDARLLVETPIRASESLYVEAVSPGN